MPRGSQHNKEGSFNFRIDPKLKSAFQAATEAEDKPAAQAAEAHRQSMAIAARAADPNSDEAAVINELETNLAGFAEEWK